jgi:large subunit ribosomal protein L25
MEQQVIEVEHRGPSKKGAARKLRASGKIPGILYGHKEAPVPFAVNPHELRKRIRTSGMGRNTLFTMRGLGRDVMVLLKDTQVDPVRRDLLHVDFIEVREGDMVHVDVPFVFSGKPEGVTAGGELAIVRRTITVSTNPLTIPQSIAVDLTPIQLGQALHASDLKYPDGVVCINPKDAVATVRAPRAEVVEETPGAVAAEGEEGAAPAEGAAAAPAEAKGKEKAE